MTVALLKTHHNYPGNIEYEGLLRHSQTYAA